MTAGKSLWACPQHRGQWAAGVTTGESHWQQQDAGIGSACAAAPSLHLPGDSSIPSSQALCCCVAMWRPPCVVIWHPLLGRLLEQPSLRSCAAPACPAKLGAQPASCIHCLLPACTPALVILFGWQPLCLVQVTAPASSYCRRPASWRCRRLASWRRQAAAAA